MGAPAMTARAARRRHYRPAFYARTGDLLGDSLALLHPPYTAWHLSYVACGATLAPTLDWTALSGTLLAFFCGTGIAAHALDEWHGRPLGTRFSGRALLAIASAGVVGGGVLAVLGALVISPWVLAWGAAGTLLMLGYTLEWHPALHSDVGFALTWGAFPALVGYWAQAGRIGPAVVALAFAATLLSLAQRSLSTPARLVRRKTADATVHFESPSDVPDWGREALLSSWERPLKFLVGTVIALAASLLLTRT